ncbi:MAG: hypothetical protein EPO28_08740 [Saprospiraceae bacterium]|nr:MAG: hypothetical protein EPO28_08740 [Saprospiraceae bacterium]
MKGILTFIGVLAVLATSMTCHKNSCPAIVEEPINVDTISFYSYDRDDIPPPPSEPWWTLDTTNLDTCQSLLWGYLKRMYPIREEDYWDYDLYAIVDEPGEVFENRAFVGEFYYFFNDTLLVKTLNAESRPCANVDTTFFLQALGPPTCKSYGFHTGQTNYFYYFKRHVRSGPCPYLFDLGNEYEHKCNTDHFKYCGSLMKIFFEAGTGKLMYIDFWWG